MTLILDNCDYKYELEGVMKLFIPATLFKHIDAKNTEKADFSDDNVRACIDYEGDTAGLLIRVEMNGRTAVREKKVILSEDPDKELILSGMLYEALSEITGKKPKWGIITGVRPVKQVNKMLAKGLDKSEIFDILQKDYLCSEEKCEMAYKTAMVQKKILDNIDPKSFSLYVSIPFCPTRCSYCSFVSQSIDHCMDLIPEYVDKLCEEIVYTGKIVAELGLRLDTVYFGGGTPTTLSAGQLVKIMDTIENNFDMSAVREYTIEAGRPDTITEEKLIAIKNKGCKRISINPQTLNDKVLEVIGRKHTTEQFFKSFELAEKIGFDCINTDIIAGLSQDTEESFKNTVDKLTEMSPENITVHTLSIKRAARLNQGDKKELENPADKMIEYANQKLLKAGYQPYYLYRQKNMVENLENIGWCKAGFESLYNIYIMEEIQSIIAVGAGASIKLVDIKGNELKRIFNYKFPIEYIKHFELMLERKNEMRTFYAEQE